jgi:YD repeat-containing protein
MTVRPISAAFVLGFALFTSPSFLRAQLATASPDEVRVTVSMNADGTRTTYEFDAPHRRATATTTATDNKVIGKIRYVLDDEGRFASGDVYGPDDKLRFKTLYKYDAGGRLIQESQLGPDDALRNKIVYAYDKNGKQTGYTVYDANGKLLQQTPGAVPRSPTPAKHR